MITIIQARSTSTRLRNKINCDIHGQTLLQRCVAAVAPVSTPVIVLPFDDVATRAQCISNNWQYREGPEMDVLTRYLSVVRAYPQETHFARVTSDCSLISTSELHYMSSLSGDYITNCRIDPREGMEIEILSRRGWEWLDTHAQDNGYREHVTQYLALAGHAKKFLADGYTIVYHREPYLAEWLPHQLSIDTQDNLDQVREVWRKWLSHSHR